MKRSWLLELGLGLLAMALGSYFLWTTLSEDANLSMPVEVLAGVCAFAGLVAFRRTRPVTLTLVLIPTGIVFGLPMGATPIALFAVGLHRRARIAAALALLHSTVVTGVYFLVLGPTRIFVEASGFIVLMHLSLVTVAMLIRSQRALVRSLAERARQAEHGQQLQVEQSRMSERERIAREMHDVLAHRISLLALHAGALEVSRDAAEQERRAAAVIRQSAYDALEELRDVIGMLRAPAEDRPQPTLGDVPALVEESRHAGAHVSLDFVVTRPVPAGVGRHAYRIVQEGLTNAHKHAPGAPVTVAVTGREDDGLVIEVGNLLHEVSSNLPGAGAGLVGLHERVQLAGGRLSHGPTERGEFQLKAWLPWDR